MAHIIVGGIIEKDGKYLLIQEAKQKCYKKWNIPAGHLECNETLFDAAKREIKEETGCDIEITGICQIANENLVDDLFVAIIFQTKLLSENIKFNPEEILDVNWFSYEELQSMKDELRSYDLVINAINNSRKNIVAPLEIIKILN